MITKKTGRTPLASFLSFFIFEMIGFGMQKDSEIKMA